LPRITRSELVGVAFILITAVLSGMRPAISKFGTQSYPPIILACFTLAFSAAAAFMIFLTKQEKAREVFSDPAEFAAIGASSGIAMLLLYLGLQTTSSIDSSLFLQAELAYSLVACYFILKEKITATQVAFSAMVFLGAIATLWQAGLPNLNAGALMILAVPAFYVASNLLSKGLLQRHTPEMIIAMRQAYGALILLATALAFEAAKLAVVFNAQFLVYSAMLGIVMTGVSFCWYNAIKRMNLSKATAIGAVEVVVGGAMAFLLFGEVPTQLQCIGAALIIAGTVLLAFRVKSEQRKSSIKA